MHFATTLCLSALAALVTATPVPQASSAGPDPNSVYITNVVWNGSGCKMGAQQDTTYSLSPNRETIEIIYSNYIAQSGPGIAPADQRKNCVLNFSLHIPDGWVFSVSETIFRGFADTSSCTAFIKASYWFSGQTGEVGAQYNFPKNALGNYEQATTVVAIYPACNVQTMFNINSEAYIHCTGGDSGELTVDALDHTYKETYTLLWKRC